jgi:hypothetical protein
MAGLGSIVRGVIPVIKGIVGGQDGVMDDITIQYWIEDTTLEGDGSYSDPVPFQAIVEKKQQMVKTRDGQDVKSTTYLGFIEAMPARGTGNGRQEPLDTRDIITLSDGSTGPILDTDGLMDRATSAPYLLEVYLG